MHSNQWNLLNNLFTVLIFQFLFTLIGVWTKWNPFEEEQHKVKEDYFNNDVWVFDSTDWLIDEMCIQLMNISGKRIDNN